MFQKKIINYFISRTVGFKNVSPVGFSKGKGWKSRTRFDLADVVIYYRRFYYYEHVLFRKNRISAEEEGSVSGKMYI